MNAAKYVALTIPAKAEYIDIARLSLYGVANRMGFSYEDIEDMKVAIAEACNNAVLHAYREPDAGSIDIRFDMSDDEMRITVTDQGMSFNFDEVSKDITPLQGKKLSELDTGGLGIYLMQALMDKVEVLSENGTQVVLTKYLKTVNI